MFEGNSPFLYFWAFFGMEGAQKYFITLSFLFDDVSSGIEHYKTVLMDSFVLHNWICWVNLWDSLNKCDITCCCFFKNLKSRKDLLFSLLPSSTKHNFYEYLWFFLWQRIWKIQKYSSQLLVCPGRAAGANFLIDVHKLCRAGRVEKI